MKKWLIRTVAVAVIAGSSTTVLAGGRSHDRYFDFAKVVGVEPIMEVVRVEDPREVCWTEQVTHTRPRGNRSVTPEILGVIIGGVVGNQFGSGRGKDLATVAGAALGGSIAHDRKIRRHGYGYDTYTEPVQRCEIRSEYYEEERIVGYDVAYRYNRKIYHTRMDRDPGDTIRVRVGVSLAE